MTEMIDAVRRRRLRWRARRGLLENDILVTRFLDEYLDGLSEGDVKGLDELLDLTDRDLLDLLLERSPAPAIELGERAGAMLARLRAHQGSCAPDGPSSSRIP